jgi:uncharacterized protein YjaZ
LNSGGTATPNGLILGTEILATTDQTPLEELDPRLRAVLLRTDDIPHVVAHELIHFQQEDFQDERGSSLLEQCLREGVADFIGEMMSGGRVNTLAYAYGDEHEEELWREFELEMNGTDISRWLYDQLRDRGERPADLGYVIGYKIARAYYARADDKQQAMRDMLRIRDPQQFLSVSRYGDSF